MWKLLTGFFIGAVGGVIGTAIAYSDMLFFTPVSAPEIQHNYWERQARLAVLDRLKDPDSAKFGTVWEGNIAGSYCGTVNAKLPVGGYAGEAEFIVTANGGARFSSDFESEAFPKNAGTQEVYDEIWRLMFYNLCLKEREGSAEPWDNLCPAKDAEQAQRCQNIGKVAFPSVCRGDACAVPLGVIAGVIAERRGGMRIISYQMFTERGDPYLLPVTSVSTIER